MSTKTEAIILAGGLGTRLRSVVSDLPKCMAPVNGIPFLHFVITQLQQHGVERFIFSLGYKSEHIIDYLNHSFSSLEKEYVIEDHPLGTGGAIQLACSKVLGKDVLIVNGDTLFNIDANALVRFHQDRNAACTIALKEMRAFSRYGSVTLGNDNRLLAFNEKQYCEQGWINGGIYALSVAAFLQEQMPKLFSFEKDFMEAFIQQKKMYGVQFRDYFIDIGIPEDYQTFINHHQAITAQNEKNAKGQTNFFEALSDLFTI